MHTDVIFYINIVCEYLLLIKVIGATASRHLPDTIFISKRIRVTLQYIVYDNYYTTTVSCCTYNVQPTGILYFVKYLRLSLRHEFKYSKNYWGQNHTILINNMVITKSICIKLYIYN